MRTVRVLAPLLLLAVLVHADETGPAKPAVPPVTTPPAATPPPAPAGAKRPAAQVPSPDDATDEEEPPSKKAPRRFNPTDQGKADEDIPFPADI